jgi:hypothetical protein
MADAGLYEGHFHFTLNGRNRFQDIKGRPCVELETKDNEDGTKSVTAFTITVESSSEEEALSVAQSQAKKLVDILAVLSGGHLGYTLSDHEISSPDRRRKMLEKSIEFSYDINSGPVDLGKNSITQAIRTRKPKDRELTLVQSLGYVNEGLGAYTNSLWQVMIKEFHLALGDKLEPRKYDHLRNALSHNQELSSSKRTKTKECVDKDFPGCFDWTSRDTLDYSSDKTIQSLRKIAIEIMNLALEYVRKNL